MKSCCCALRYPSAVSAALDHTSGGARKSSKLKSPTIQRRRVPIQPSSHCGAAAGIDCGTLPAAPREMRFSGVLKNPEDG